jgi:hypothetical protein
MGTGTMGAGGSTTGTVTNSGGDLFGPTGGDQNGGLEGECIEVKICWKYRYYVPPQIMYVPQTDGILVAYPIPGYWVNTWHCSSPPSDVCPCGSSECPTGTAPC